MDYINQSRIFTVKPSEFDLISFFEKYDEVLWIKRHNNAIVNDIIYFYIGEKYQKIMYKCIITEIISITSIGSISQESLYEKYWTTKEYGIEKNKNAEAYYRIKLLQKFDYYELSLESFQKKGLIKYNIQGKFTKEKNIELFDFIEKSIDVKKGIFNSWEILNKNVAIKRCDKSFFEHHGTGIPIEIRWFFDANKLNSGKRKDISLIFNEIEYNAYISKESSPTKRTRLFWNIDLIKIFNKFKKVDGYPCLRFKRVEEGIYEISFLETEVIDIEDNDNLESEVKIGYVDGKKVEYYITKYERDSKNRNMAIKIHGTKCMACEFDFSETYGEYGKDFIEVHHIKPLYDLEMEIVIIPEKDLVCLCSNCHRMIHRKRDKVLSVEELKKIIAKK